MNEWTDVHTILTFIAPLLLVSHQYVWLVTEQMLVCLELKIPQDPVLSLKPFQRCVPLGLRDLYPTLSTDVPIHYPNNLVIPLSICCQCLHVTPSSYVLDCLMNKFA